MSSQRSGPAGRYPCTQRIRGDAPVRSVGGMNTALAAKRAPGVPAAAILTPSDTCWDDARKAWNLAVDQRPAAIARPGSPADVVAAVEHARRHGLRVAAQGSHNAAPLGDLGDTLLVKNARSSRSASIRSPGLAG